MNPNLYRVLRILFVIGNAASFALVFAPLVQVGRGRVLTGLEIMNLLAQSGQYPLFLVLLVLVIAPIPFAVLGIVHPKRWVFITGASVATFGLLFELFQGSSPAVERIVPVQVLGYLFTIPVLVGFAIKSPKLEVSSVSGH